MKARIEMAGGSSGIVIVAMCANAAIAVAKFTASAYTGSAAMFSEGVHSAADTANQGLLLLGMSRAKKPADPTHPFGYSKEIYFWSILVAIILFGLGAGISGYEGVHKLMDPHELKYAWVIYLVLGVSIALEAYAFYKAYQEFHRRYPDKHWYSALKESKDPALFVILLEDTAALIGLFIALVATIMAAEMGFLMADGLASLMIAAVLAGVALFMAIEVKSLLIGEAAKSETQEGILAVLKSHLGEHSEMLHINELRTMHMGPNDVLAVASLDYGRDISLHEAERLTTGIEKEIQDKHPEVRRLYIEVQTQEDHRQMLEREAEQLAKENDGLSKAEILRSLQRASHQTPDPGTSQT